MDKMNEYQKNKTAELRALGWNLKSEYHHAHVRGQGPTYCFVFESESGRVCYVAPNYIQHI